MKKIILVVHDITAHCSVRYSDFLQKLMHSVVILDIFFESKESSLVTD